MLSLLWATEFYEGEKALDKEKFIMKRASLLVSLNCNLNCKLCVVGSPYHTTGNFPDVSKLIGDMDTLFHIVDYVEIVTISGGEPLLYKQLPKLLEELLNYSKYFGKIEIVTNGTIVPDNGLLEVIEKYGTQFLRFIVDDYGRDLSKKVPQIVSLLEGHQIPYRLNDYCSENLRFGGWIDHGSAEKIVHTEKEAHELFAKCAQPQKMNFCFLIENGRMSPCSVVLRRIKLGQNVDKGEYIDLTSTMSAEEQRQKIRNIYNAKCLESCAYCTDALSDDAPRFWPAVQLTAEELKEIRGKHNLSLGGNDCAL